MNILYDDARVKHIAKMEKIKEYLVSEGWESNKPVEVDMRRTKSYSESFTKYIRDEQCDLEFTVIGYDDSILERCTLMINLDIITEFKVSLVSVKRIIKTHLR